MTRAELAFSALWPGQDRVCDAQTAEESEQEVVKEWGEGLDGEGESESENMKSYFPLQLDTDEDGKLSFEEFRVLFVNQEKRKRRLGKRQKR